MNLGDARAAFPHALLMTGLERVKLVGKKGPPISTKSASEYYVNKEINELKHIQEKVKAEEWH